MWESMTVRRLSFLLGMHRAIDPVKPVVHIALIDAIKYRADLEVIKLLIDQAEYVDRIWFLSEYDLSLRPPLVYAVLDNGDHQIIDALIDAGADVNARDPQSRTPLMHALMSNAGLHMVEHLLAAGADFDVRDHGGTTPLLLAASMNPTPPVLAALISAGADTNARDAFGRSALMLLTANDLGLEPYELLLSHGAEINARDSAGRTALMHATRHRVSTPIVRYLLDLGSDVRARDVAGRTALIHAVWSQPVGIGESALRNHFERAAQSGISDVENGLGHPIHAILDEQLATIRMLAAAGSRIQSRDEHGRDSLFYAVAGIESTKPDGTAERTTSLPVPLSTRPLTWSQAPEPQIAPLSLHNPPPEIISLLLNLGANARTRDDRGTTALMQAAVFNGNSSVVRLLIDAGADVNARNRNRDTALTLAARWGRSSDVVRQLIDAGANVRHVNGEGKTAWDLIQDNARLGQSEAYWMLNQTRFE